MHVGDYLCAGVSVVVRVQLVLLNFFGVDVADRALRHLLAHARVDLTHLRALTDLEPLVLEVVGRLHGAATRGGPDRERPQRHRGAALLDEGGVFLLAVLQEDLRHAGRIGNAFLGEGGVSFVGILLVGDTGPNEVGGARLDVQICEVEDDAVGEVVEGNVVVEEFTTRIDHLDVVQFLLVHGLEDGNLHVDAAEVEFRRLIGIHTGKLGALARQSKDKESTHIGRRNLDVTRILTKNGLVIHEGLDEERLFALAGLLDARLAQLTCTSCFASSLAKARRPAAVGFTAS